QFARMLRDIPGTLGVGAFTVDRCPRCNLCTSIGIPPNFAASDVLPIWLIFKSGELARAHAYFAFALQSARENRLDVARDVALETAGHVTMEDPRVHLLLGRIGIATNDKTLLREAKSFLAFLKDDARLAKLDASYAHEFTDID